MSAETYDNEEAWLAARSGTIGSSDSAAICEKPNVGNHTRFTVWARIVKKAELERELSIPMRIGIALEPLIGELYQEETGRIAERNGMCIWKNDDCPIAHATPDFVVGNPADKRGMEAKSVGLMRARKWDSAPPDEVILQVHHQMMVMDFEIMDVMAIIAGNTVVIATVERDEKLITALRCNQMQFWESYVDTAIAPPVTADDLEPLRYTFPRSVPKKVISLEGTKWDLQLASWNELDKQIRWRDMARDELKAGFMAELADAESGTTESGSSVSWKSNKHGQRSLRKKIAKQPRLESE